MYVWAKARGVRRRKVTVPVPLYKGTEECTEESVGDVSEIVP